ncbi:hypothetical protein QWT69_09995 [Sporosarcina oncorhynchi]|uniref:DUF4129 domain-containing protein n=1 Tax=Sporosarcina oncorhynchi TaxID=3056444 RepID=A0ABZ0L0Y3_9BACL|nr:hypothetical protein [Sporosarcina sp. T2O-4]WOV86275.1 hypothetical protein QWT69_09995 [Sporosarcina sp. T2O-4]
MGETTLEKDRNRFSYSERLVVELFLLAYIFAFFLGETNSGMAYIWLGISIIAGFASYFLFNGRGYSLGLGVGLALILTVPLLLFAVPLMNVVIFFAYILWRIQGNFNGSKINGWPFLIINTFVFVTLTALARLLFVYGNPDVLVAKQMSIYLLTSFLYFFIRMITIWFNGKQLNNFKMADANKAFASIVTLGAIVFVSILTLLKPVRLGIFLLFGYLFNSIFTLFGKASSPVLDYIREEAERIEEEEEEDHFIDFRMEEEAKVFGASASPFEIAMYVLVFVILIAIIVMLVKKNRESRQLDKQDAYTFSFRGKKKKENALSQLTYDYSKARDEVRKKFEKFENEAKIYGCTRSQSETVNEWFLRMGWSKDNRAITIYNEVRYGSHIPTEKELEVFRSELEKIKEKFFVKEV